MGRSWVIAAALLSLIACTDDPKSSATSGDGGGGATSAQNAAGAGGTGGQQGGGGQGGAEAPYPDVGRIDLPASFVQLPNGNYELSHGLALFDATRAFYEKHGDDYDFVIVYTDFRIDQIWQFELTTNVNISGIGQELVYQQHFNWPLDWYNEAGSMGELDAVVLMNDTSLWDSAAFTAQEILTHEVGHRWGASMLLPSASDEAILLDASLAHWARVASVGGPSALGYGHLSDNGDGSFTHATVRPLAYAPLELYAMGLIAPNDPSLGNLFYVTGAPDEDAVAGDATFAGTRVDLTIAEIEQALGMRTPAFPNAQTAFRFAFTLVCDGVCDEQTIAWVDGQRTAWEQTFATATGNRATASTSL